MCIRDSYMRVLKEARRRSVEEFAVALHVDEDAVEERFEQAIAQAAIASN